MGQDVDAREFSREDRTLYRAKVRRCLDVFARMLSERDFSFEHAHVGIEIEFNLVDDHGDPALKNAEALEAIADEVFQTELGLFNIEINVPPSRIEGTGLDTLQETLRADLNEAQRKASEVGAHLVMIGILPTLQEGHFTPSHCRPTLAITCCPTRSWPPGVKTSRS